MCYESCLVVGLIINCWVLQDDIDSVLSEKHEWVVGGARGYLAPSGQEGVFIDGLGWTICVRSDGGWQNITGWGLLVGI